MNAYKKYKNKLERFLQTERGRRVIHFAYSIGAAIVILGAMFKWLYLPFANEMLMIGLATECAVFILSAFDTPIRDYRWDKVFPALSPTNSDGLSETSRANEATVHAAQQTATQAPLQQAPSPTRSHTPSTYSGEDSSSPIYPTSPSAKKNHDAYALQMENLNRTLQGLNSMYEIQLKGVSCQIAEIEHINQRLARMKDTYGDTLPQGDVIKQETEKMANQLKELNHVYARMLEAMTVKNHDNSNNPQA